MTYVLDAQHARPHIVAQGETLYKVSRQYGVSAAALAHYNGIKHPGHLSIGQVLRIPPAGLVWASAPADASWAVVPAPPSAAPREVVKPVGPRESKPAAAHKPSVAVATSEVQTKRPVSEAAPPEGQPAPTVAPVAALLLPKLAPVVAPVAAALAAQLPLPIADTPLKPHAAPVKLAEALAAVSPARKGSHGPQSLQWPVSGTVTSRFGRRHGRAHDGIDIGAPLGSQVRAAADGDVVFSDSHRGYGNVVILRHPDGLMTIYAHHQRNLVASGQHVRQGDPIAQVGSTGRASGPHLHFEVRRRAQPRDPLRFLPVLLTSR